MLVSSVSWASALTLSSSMWTYRKSMKNDMSCQILPCMVLKGIGLDGLISLMLYCECALRCHVTSNPSRASGSAGSIVMRVPALMPSNGKCRSSCLAEVKIGLSICTVLQPSGV